MNLFSQKNDLVADQVNSSKKAKEKKLSQPLAFCMRPRNLEEFVGQEHLVAAGKFLHDVVLSGSLPSIIFWGPPGSGKTSLAFIIAQKTKAHFLSFSAVTSGVADIRKVIQAARQKKLTGQRTILFIDEIHRFNKAQQDALLPHVEDGTIILIGATTENPSFEVISALLSRCKVLVLEQLSEQEIFVLLKRALQDTQRGLGNLNIQIEEKDLEILASLVGGDARLALNALEDAVTLASVEKKDDLIVVTIKHVKEAWQRKIPKYDKDGEGHYNLISALHKSMRGCDPDAALYWLARMLDAGEDPLYIARRMVRFATEDVGLADPRALNLAIAARDAVHFIGLPEGALALAETAVYLALAPKSVSIYKAFQAALADAKKTSHLEVPLHIRNAPTKLMKQLGYGKNYKYGPDYEDSFTFQEYLPAPLKSRRYYYPTNHGEESVISKRLEFWKRKAIEQEKLKLKKKDNENKK